MPDERPVFAKDVDGALTVNDVGLEKLLEVERSILYDVAPDDAVQERSIWDDDFAVAENPVGGYGIGELVGGFVELALPTLPTETDPGDIILGGSGIGS